MSRPPFTWRLSWPLTLLALALLPLLSGLGVWQLQRSQEKAELAQAFEARRRAAPIAFRQLLVSPPDYTRVEVSGSYDNERSLLLDNRVLDGRVGFEVITPFQVEGDPRRLLVNRGWIEGDPARRQLPVIPPVAGRVRLTGYLYRDSEGFRLGAESVTAAWPRVLQGLNFPLLVQWLDEPLHEFTLRLDPAAPGALRPHWVIVNAAPERHVGYAVQWFAMAVALLVAWLLANSNAWQWMRNRHD